MTDKIVILSTCETEADAKRIAAHLVETGLAACVNIVPGATSVYRWKGAIETANEWLLIIKSRRDYVSRIEQAFVAVHPYDVPELIALPIVEGASRYMEWLAAELPDESGIA